jgi:hypothetical protein
MRQDSHRGLANIEYGHHLVHSALLAFISDVQSAVTSVVYGIRVGALPLHVAIRALLSTGGSIVITEGVTSYTDGTILPWTNYNRIDNPLTKKPATIISRTPTAVSGGTALAPFYVPASAAAPYYIGVRGGVEFNLAANGLYLLTLTLPSGATQIDMDGYEELN